MWLRLGRHAPIWRKVDTSARWRIKPVPQRRTACRCGVQRLFLHPDLGPYLVDIGALLDEGDDAHRPATQGVTTAGTLRRCGRSTPTTAGHLGDTGWADSNRLGNALPAAIAPSPALAGSGRACTGRTAAFGRRKYAAVLQTVKKFHIIHAATHPQAPLTNKQGHLPAPIGLIQPLPQSLPQPCSCMSSPLRQFVTPARTDIPVVAPFKTRTGLRRPNRKATAT